MIQREKGGEYPESNRACSSLTQILRKGSYERNSWMRPLQATDGYNQGVQSSAVTSERDKDRPVYESMDGEMSFRSLGVGAAMMRRAGTCPMQARVPW